MCLSGNCSTCQRERAVDRDRELEKAKSAKQAELAALTPDQCAALNTFNKLRRKGMI